MTVYDPDFCPYCGDPVETDAHGAGSCEACDRFVGRAPVPAVECTVVEGDRAPVVRRAAGRETGTWALPGGHLEPGDDSPAAAAARELAEETGLRVDPADLRLLDSLLEENDDGSVYLTVGFVAAAAAVEGDATATRPAEGEVAAVRFVDPASFTAPTFRASDPERLARAVRLVDGAE